MSLLSARSRESSNQEAGHGSKPKHPAAEAAQPNPVWQRIATRIQTKLGVSAPTDPDEREADRIAGDDKRPTESRLLDVYDMYHEPPDSSH